MTVIVTLECAATASGTYWWVAKGVKAKCSDSGQWCVGGSGEEFSGDFRIYIHSTTCQAQRVISVIYRCASLCPVIKLRTKAPHTFITPREIHATGCIHDNLSRYSVSLQFWLICRWGSAGRGEPIHLSHQEKSKPSHSGWIRTEKIFRLFEALVIISSLHSLIPLAKRDLEMWMPASIILPGNNISNTERKLKPHSISLQHLIMLCCWIQTGMNPGKNRVFTRIERYKEQWVQFNNERSRAARRRLSPSKET